MSPFEEGLRCPICGFRYPKRRTREGRSYRLCPACGLMWGEFVQVPEENEEFYRSSEIGNSISSSKRELFEHVLLRAERARGGPGKVLDVGCGPGAFLKLARERGWNAVGVDPVKSLVDAGREQGLDMHRGTLADLDESLADFDLITWWDVLMFVDDPVAELQRALTRLAKRGHLYLRVRQSAIQRPLHSLWAWTGPLVGWKDPSVFHPWNFTPRSMRLLGKTLGIEMEIEAGRLSAGDSYKISKSGETVTVIKRILDAAFQTLGKLSGQHFLLSPTMDVWGRPI